jgi:hypothetical protein
MRVFVNRCSCVRVSVLLHNVCSHASEFVGRLKMFDLLISTHTHIIHF